MPFKIQPDDGGEEKEVYGADEFQAVQKEAAEAKAQAEAMRTQADEARKAAEDAKRVAAEQTQNFKKLRDMTEEEKSKLTADQISVKAQAEAAEARAQALEERWNNETKSRVEKAKEKSLAAFHRGDAELKKKLEENYELVKLEGTDEDTIARRAELAYNMLGTGKPRINPLTQSFSGEAPNALTDEDFSKTERGQAALREMGLL